MGKTISAEQIIKTAAVVASLTPVKDEVSKQDMIDIALEDKPFGLRVLPVYIEANQVAVGKVLLKFADFNIGCVTKEEFEELKKEGKYHGIQ